MTLGDIILKAVREDLSAAGQKHLAYTEFVKDGKFEIRMTSSLDKDAYIECSIPDKGLEEEKNYLRMYFLSMAFNAAIYGMRRKNNKKHK